MSSVPMPRDLSIKTVALWLRDALPGRVWPTDEIDIDFVIQAEAVRALLREKVREAVMLTHRKWRDATDPTAWHPMVLPLVREVTTELLGEEAPRG